MATENQTESSQPGEQDLPNPTFSDTGDSSTSGGADELVSKLTPVIEQIVQRTVQSTKDKRISKIEKALGGRLDLLAELEEQGVPIPKEVRTEMQIRELQDRIAQQSTQPAPVRDDGSSQQKAAVTEAIAELQKYGLSSDDPDFLGLLRGKYSNRAAFDLEVQRHIVKKIVPPKPASPADVVQPPVTGGAQPKGKDQLEMEYQKEIAQIAQTQKGDAKIRAITALKAKYREAGLEKY